MGMSERDQNTIGKQSSFFERIDLVPLVVIILVGIVVIGLLVPDKFKEFSEIIRNWAFVVGGVVGFLLAWRRILYTEKQTEIAVDQIKIATDQVGLANKQIDILGREEKRKDQERIEARLEGAVRLLGEPTDSMKHFAITQLEQIAKEYPEQALASAISCLSGHAKEYDPLLGEKEQQLIAGKAKDKCFRERMVHVSELDKVIRDNSATQVDGAFDDPQARYDSVDSARNTKRKILGKEYIETEETTSTRNALLDELERRSREMTKKLVGAVNRLALQAGHTDPNTNKRIRDESAAFFDLCGVEIFSATIHRINVDPPRFRGCTFDDVTFHNCTFTGTFEKFTKFLNCTFRNCNFGTSELSAVNFKGCDFSGSIITDSTLRHVVWYDCSLCRVELTRMKMSKKLDKMFASSDMTGVIFHIKELPTGIQVPDDLRLNYLAADFQANYVKKDGALPVGLDRNVPSLDAKVVRESEDGEHQHFSVEPFPESQ